MLIRTGIHIWNKRKKGQTLIEVMLSLTIITLVFVSAITLVINVFNLTLSARSKTKATALAQSGLAVATTKIQGSCSLGNYPLDAAISLPEVSVPTGFTLEVRPKDLITGSEIYTGDQITTTNFMKLTATVSWSDKGLGAQTYRVSEIIRK
jgi:Tfp pilus assembly protein PilX